MREIKFRIFDKKIGKIFKAHDLRFTAEEAVYEVCHDTITDTGVKHWTSTDFKEIVLMQFTGLKDIEEKEIYEGDVISGYNNPHVVTFVDGAYYLTYKNSSTRLSRTCGALKIIGNIYENPELKETTS